MSHRLDHWESKLTMLSCTRSRKPRSPTSRCQSRDGLTPRFWLGPTRSAAENLDERFGDPGGPDPGEAPSSAASASCMRERAAQELNPEMGRMGAEDPST